MQFAKVDLLDKSCVRAKDSGEVLLRVLKGPLTQYLPENARILGKSQYLRMSCSLFLLPTLLPF